jgi:hypothetical protein
MGSSGKDSKVSKNNIAGVGNYILNDAKKTGKKEGKIQLRDANINKVDNETKINSGYETPPIVIDAANIKH